MNLVGTDAMALGLNELSLGSVELRKRMAEATFPMLSANVTLTGTADLFGSPYVIVDVGGYQVGLFGLTRLPAGAVADFQVQDPSIAASQILPELERKVSVVILLTNLDYRAAMELAAKVTGIDLVIAANPGQLPSDVVTVPGTHTLIVAAEQPVAHHTGRRVGRLAVTINSDGVLADPEWRSVALDKTFADDPDMAVLLDQFRQ